FPASADSRAALVAARTWVPAPPSQGDPGIPAVLDAPIARALQLERERRFQSAEDFSTALVRIARDLKRAQRTEPLPPMLRRLFPDEAEPFLLEAPPADRTAAEKPSYLSRAVLPREVHDES